ANARRQMDDQAKQLEANASANREILAYKLAVEKYNQRDLKGAQKIVDELVATAADPQVKADAAKLQALIRERLQHRELCGPDIPVWPRMRRQECLRHTKRLRECPDVRAPSASSGDL